MEGKSKITDLSCRTHFFQIWYDPKCFYLLKFCTVKRMKQIKIYIIFVQTFHLFLKNLFRILQCIQLPDWQLCRKIARITVIFFQHSPHERFTVPIVIRICCINVIDTRCDCPVDHVLCFCLVNLLIRCQWKSHTSKSKK